MIALVSLWLEFKPAYMVLLPEKKGQKKKIT